MTNRREFVVQLGVGASALLAGGQVFAQAMVDEKDAPKLTTKNLPHTSLTKIALTARCTRPKPVTRQAAVLCLQAKKWQAPVGAVPGPKKGN